MLQRLLPKPTTNTIGLSFILTTSYALIDTINPHSAEEQKDNDQNSEILLKSDEELEYLASLARTELKKLKKKKENEKNKKKIDALKEEIRVLEEAAKGTVIVKDKVEKDVGVKGTAVDVVVEEIVVDRVVIPEGSGKKDKKKGKKGKKGGKKGKGSEVLVPVDVDDYAEVDIPLEEITGKKDNKDGKKGKKGPKKDGKVKKEGKEVAEVPETPEQVAVDAPVLNEKGEAVDSVHIEDKKESKKEKKDKKDKKDKDDNDTKEEKEKNEKKEKKEKEPAPEFQVLYLGEKDLNQTFDNVDTENNYILGRAKFSVGVNQLLANQPCSSIFMDAISNLENFEKEQLYAKYNLSLCYTSEKNFKSASKTLSSIKQDLEGAPVNTTELENYLSSKSKKK